MAIDQASRSLSTFVYSLDIHTLHGLCRGVPGDYLLFQIGETAQVHSGGYLKATPHMVRGCTTPGVSRSTMAVFLEPGHAETMAMPDSRCIYCSWRRLPFHP